MGRFLESQVRKTRAGRDADQAGKEQAGYDGYGIAARVLALDVLSEILIDLTTLDIRSIRTNGPCDAATHRVPSAKVYRNNANFGVM